MYKQHSDHISLNVASGSQEALYPHQIRRHRNLKRYWRSLTKCQRTLVTLSLLLIGLFLTYSVLGSGNGAVIDVSAAAGDSGESDRRPEYLKNMRNDPRDADELPGANGDAVVQVLEEPEGAQAPQHVGQVQPQQQVLQPPKVHIQFSGPANSRQKAVVDAFQHGWQGYRRFAWGHDHLKPISQSYHDWFGLGLSIVDSLDTMYIMGLTKEYKEARDWVEKRLQFDINRDVNLFEVTIRVLGGLLSIYHLSGDNVFLEKAQDLGDRLLPCFESESGVPFSDINLFTKKAKAPKWSPDSSTSEVTTIQLEFRDLSRSTNNMKYEKAAARVSEHVHTLPKKDGLVPIFINANSGQFRTYSTVTLGARGDSYYEYLLKQWLQTGRTIDYLRDDYIEAIQGVETHLVRKTVPNGYLFVGELLVGGKDFKPKMDHLTCYLPGTLALGVHLGMPQKHMQLAEQLLNTCYQTYAQQPTFLAPEITYFNIQGENSNDMYVKSNDAHSLLRPEFIESLWYMYQLTGNTTYQDWGWRIFQAIEKHAKTVNGYTSIGNVRNPANLRPKDMMESFFLSETLKYLYLLFADDRKLIDLDKYVVNSEAHPLPIYDN